MSYPTGTVIYLKDKCYSGYNIVSTIKSGVLIFDMNGNEIRRYKMNAMPAKLFKGGNVMGTSKFRSSDYSLQDGVSLIEIDYDGNKKWSYENFRFIEDGNPMWAARAHGDYQREGNPVGYFVPNMEAKSNGGNTIILGHDTIVSPAISDKKILDEVIYEVDYEGNVIWKFSFSENFESFGFSEQEKNVIYRNPNMKNISDGIGDYLHISSISVLGPNKWYDQGDIRFCPENIIFCSRQGNFIGIIDKKTKKVYWKIGPNVNDEIFRGLGGIIAPTHIQLIPKGLPGEGNILFFESGGTSGYGYPNLISPTGLKNAIRDYSRVIEFNPITWNIEWELNPAKLGFSNAINGYKFYSPYGSSVQRLPNGNTLVTLGTSGTMLEITEEGEIVWKWICPYASNINAYAFTNFIYHGYRYPYDYLPEENPVEIEMKPVNKSTFRLEGAGEFNKAKVIEVEGAEISNDIDLITMAMENDEEIAYQKKIISMENSNIKSINSKNFDRRLEEKENAIVIFGAVRCIHCKALREIISELIESEFKNINCYYLDIDENKSMIRKHDIKSVPITMFFKNSQEVYRFIGESSYDEIAQAIEKYFKIKSKI
ncbi:thioredoxin domain-containing protein [Peptoniphilus sp. oral taxon 386]|uniref:thioredoxin domain-containing protein n=1 Tax=Peptoniphilus sp. oral taxon 386 TaxID=652713 RepID=UPI0001DA9D24|nr:thioredoxin domain-containing protein [Peptoniphilus sp. oral taxon 386]EFI42693.1 thioredoxin [Peptoniphilus sp. oral taxon 386 str. F0131]